MYTTREFYLKKADAMQAAGEFQKLFGGYIGETSATNDIPWTYIDRDALNLDWGGETEAVLPGEYCDILALWVHPEYKERAQVLLSTKDDSGQIFEDVSILPYSLQKQLINYLKN